MNFFEAISQGRIEDVKQQVTANPGLLAQRDPHGFLPLTLATYHHQYNLTQYFLEQGVNVNAQDAAGNTALMGVCFKGYSDMAQLLLEHGAAVNVQNSQGATALIYAATFGQLEIAQLLLEHGADKSLEDHQGKTAYWHAQSKGVPGVMELLED